MNTTIKIEGKIELYTNGNHAYYTRVRCQRRSDEFAGWTLEAALIAFNLRVARGY